MKPSPLAPVAFALLGFASCLLAFPARGEDAVPLFNGRDLEGWDGDPALWKVVDGVIVGTCGGPGTPPRNDFLVWRGGILRDFELTVTMRVLGDNNSGIQYRSRPLPEVGPWAIAGYQCDVHPANQHLGMTYEEKGRGIFGLNGQSVVLDPEGRRWLVGEHEPVVADVSEWQTYKIVARGNRLVHSVGGRLTSQLVDHDEKGRALEGLLAIQLHSGNANSVEVREVLLEALEPYDPEPFDLPEGAREIERPRTSNPQGLGPAAPAAGASARPDPVASALDAHLAAHPAGDAPFTFDASAYRGDLSQLPIGVFDSGIGGLTVLEAILSLDAFHNDDLKPGPDGRPDFENERFVYLGDQANMPYGNYPKSGKADYLRELILKDAVFLLGRRYHKPEGGEARFDKPPVKAIVIACNTATAYGYEDVKAAVARWGLPVLVVGVVEAGARGLLETEEEGAIGVMATVGTCDSGVYPRTIQSTLGRAGRGVAAVTQLGSADLAAVIEGDPSRAATVSEQVAGDVRRLVEAHRDSSEDGGAPLSRIVLGCTHFPLVLDEIEAAFAGLREDAAYAPWIAERRHYVDPAEWTARQLFRDLASAKLRRRPCQAAATERDLFFLSVVDPSRSNVRLSSDGGLHESYKYGRAPGGFAIEDTIVVPLTREILPESGRRLVKEALPEVWGRLPSR
jgi:glutamate racemase